MKGCTVERARNGCHINTNYARLLLESLCHTHLIILLVFYIRRGVRCWQADCSVQKVLEIENVEFLNTDNILTIVTIVLPGSAPEYTWVEFALLWLFKTSFSVVLSIPTCPNFYGSLSIAVSAMYIEIINLEKPHWDLTICPSWPELFREKLLQYSK